MEKRQLDLSAYRIEAVVSKEKEGEEDRVDIR